MNRKIWFHTAWPNTAHRIIRKDFPSPGYPHVTSDTLSDNGQPETIETVLKPDPQNRLFDDSEFLWALDHVIECIRPS